MSYNVHSKLIIGASAKQIFDEYETTTQKVPLYTVTGERSGEFADLISKYLAGPNGKKFLVGTNQWNQLSPECRYRFQNLALQANLHEDWVHTPSSEIEELQHVIIGRSIGELNDLNPFLDYASPNIGRVMTNVTGTLRRVYGYKGGVRIYSMIYHSY